MNKIFANKLIIVTILILSAVIIPLSGSSAFAQTATKAPAPTVKIDPEIQSLKDKIATKVAELRKGQEKVISGRIAKIQNDTLIIPYQGQLLSVSVDDTITEIFSVSSGKKELKRSDLKVGDYIILKGIIIDNIITANTIYKDDEFMVISGTITNIDIDAGTLKVTSLSKQQYTVNVESSTKQQMLDINSLLMVTTGLSKIKEGDTIHIVAVKPVDTKATQITALKTFTIPQEYFIAPTSK